MLLLKLFIFLKWVHHQSPYVFVYVWLLALFFTSLPQINELSNVPVPVMLMPDDFKAYSKIKVDNHLFNK